MDSQPRSTAPSHQPVYIVDGARTPFLKARGKPGPFTPVDLAVQCGRPLLMRQGLSPDAFDQVILGCVNVVSEEMNPARVAALRLGMGAQMPAFSVQINCGSGMQSIDTGYRYIRDGGADLILAGGAEALSHAPLLFKRSAVDWFAELNQARSLPAKLKALARFRPSLMKPVIGLERGLTDPIVDLNMGQTAEVVAQLFNVQRESADAYALLSHQRLAAAQEAGWLQDEVVPLFDKQGKQYSQDDGVRPNNSMDALGQLKPVFEKPYGQVTAGNSSQITDGASWVVLASEKALIKHNLTPLAVIVDSHWAALEPEIMGLGPVLSSTALLQRHGHQLADIDLWEINEAFAAQVLACLEAWQDASFCKHILGLDHPMGRLDPGRLNIDGGAISLGHPVGTSGNRIVLHLVKALQRHGMRRGIATECIGGGQSGAMLIETL
ncbi:MAG: acetyl-CoA C-acetyltransferase [Halopseudomonas sabulinigri]